MPKPIYAEYILFGIYRNLKHNIYSVNIKILLVFASKNFFSLTRGHLIPLFQEGFLIMLTKELINTAGI